MEIEALGLSLYVSLMKSTIEGCAGSPYHSHKFWQWLSATIMNFHYKKSPIEKFGTEPKSSRRLQNRIILAGPEHALISWRQKFWFVSPEILYAPNFEKYKYRSHLTQDYQAQPVHKSSNLPYHPWRCNSEFCSSKPSRFFSSKPRKRLLSTKPPRAAAKSALLPMLLAPLAATYNMKISTVDTVTTVSYKSDNTTSKET